VFDFFISGGNMSSEEVKSNILLATINCIEQNGVQAVTIRKIAEMAKVNVAAVNYHFGSKEQLIRQVMNQTLDESFVQNIQDYEGMWKSDARKALQHFLEDTLEGAINYPNITKAHLADTFNKNDFDTNSVQRLNVFLSKFHGLIRNILRQDDDLKSKIAISQLFSAFLMIGMMPDLFSEFLNYDLKNKENQQNFVETLLENFCKKNKDKI